MKVLVDGSDFLPINKIAVSTFLNGLFIEYKDDLSIAYRGDGHISDITEDWLKRKASSKVSRQSFSAAWLLKGLFDQEDPPENPAYPFIEDYKPDLIFLFGMTDLDYIRPARYKNIPLFIVSKND